MIFNIMEFSNYQVTKEGIVYNKYNKPVKRRWLGEHIVVHICNTNKRKRTVRVDKLVYQTYVENLPYEYELEHIDGNDANCKLENLKYVSISKTDDNTDDNTDDKTNNVSTKLSQHNITLTQNEKDVLPIRFVKQTCQLDGHEWKVFKQELQICGVKEKRTNKFRILTNLKLSKED